MSATSPTPTPREGHGRIFLCHCSDDKKAVKRLYDRLKKDRFQPWLDKEDLPPGAEWAVAIPEAVRNSAVVLVCLSKTFIAKTGFGQKEIRVALDAADEKPEGANFIIPVRLEDVEVPERLKRWQRVDLFEPHFETGYGRLVKALKSQEAQVMSKEAFAVDLYYVSLEVAPYPENDKVEATYGSNRRILNTNNKATIRKQVIFSDDNQCQDQFELSYRTRNLGWLGIRNLGFVDKYNVVKGRRNAYPDNGTDFMFMFTPQEKIYTLDLDVYKGFDKGHRDLHCYLGEQTRCRQFVLKLDLTAYVQPGNESKSSQHELISPQLAFFESDSPEFDSYVPKTILHPVCHKATTRCGVWEWSLLDKTGGVIYLNFEDCLDRL